MRFNNTSSNRGLVSKSATNGGGSSPTNEKSTNDRWDNTKKYTIIYSPIITKK